jgi:ribose transport system substrate-binding protein
MSQLKKLLVVSLSLVLILAFAGCSSKPSASNNTTDAKATPTTTDSGAKKKYVIGFAQSTMNAPFRVAMADANKKYAEDNFKDVEFVITDAQNKATKQVDDVESLLARKIDVLMISPITAEALTPVVKKVMDAGIPVITLDRKVLTPVTMHIGGNNLEIGQTAAKFLADTLKGKGAVIEIQGTAGSSATIDRDNGFREALKAYPDMKVLADQYANYQRGPAMKFMEDVIQRFGPGQIQAIYAQNDEMALGAIQALETAKRLNEVKVVSIDGQNLAIDAVKDGKLTATYVYPLCAPEGIQYAYKIAKGEKVPVEVTLESQRIDFFNVAQFVGKGF